MIKGRFAQNIDILRVNDIMAYSRLSADNVVSHIFGDEDSFDDSDSESGEDIYGYLGAFALSRHELEEESRILTGGVDEEEDQISSEDVLANNEEPLGEDLCENNIEQASYSAIEDDGRNECDAIAMELTNSSIDGVNEGDTTNSVPPALESLSQRSNEASDVEIVSDLHRNALVLIEYNYSN